MDKNLRIKKLSNLIIAPFIVIIIAFAIYAQVSLGVITLAYKYINEKIPVYSEECYPKFTYENKSSRDAHCEKSLVGYEDKAIKTDKIIGIYEDDKLIKDAYFFENIMSRWDIPTGDRNFIEFPLCRDYEKEKGVCHES